jgi:hypothetical protein
MTLRTNCGGCDGTNLELFLDLGETPLADALVNPKDEVPEKWYKLQVAVCTDCWLAQQLEVVPREEMFNDNYTFFSGTSPAKVEYQRAYAEKLMKLHERGGKLLTVEIASNDGDMLRHFKNAGWKTLGVDPASTQSAHAYDNYGIETLVEHFGLSVAKDMRAEYGKAGLVIANHVAAHVEDLHDFFGGISALLTANGVAVIESQYLGDLLVGNQFDHVYHEHRFFFSMLSMGNVAVQHGLYIQNVELTEPQGGSIQITFGKKEGMSLAAVNLFHQENKWLQNASTYAGVQGRAERIKEKLRSMLLDEFEAGKRIAGYGAPAKSTTLLNFCEINRDHDQWLEFIEDTTPEKQGLVTPGTHIPVVAPGTYPAPDVFLLLVWNYAASIIRREREFIEGGGRFIAPIPAPSYL